jgi:hypothetical protein
MNEEPEEKTQLEKLYDWYKKDAAAQEGLIILIASTIAFLVLIALVWGLTQITLT